jgi:O-antigen ligase/polysaccharide polymerase Wzy-like membrane protein
MTSMTYHTRSRSFRRGFGDALSVVKKGQRSSPTTTIERLLLMAMIVIFPIEPFLPVVGEATTTYTTTFIIFAISAGYVLLRRPGTLARTCIHPVFLAAFVFLILAALIESAHPFSHYIRIFRIGQMFVAATFVASLCRDRRALRASIYAFLIAGILVSILLLFTTYGALRDVTATDFSEAGKVRKDVFADSEMSGNSFPFFASQGATVALALALMARSPLRRNLFLGITLFCTVATFLPMSRGVIVILGVSCATIMFAYGVRHARILFIAAVLAVGGLIWIPEAAFARLTIAEELRDGGGGTRRWVYKAAIDHLPEYLLTGVGAGNFKGPWGESTNFYRKKARSVYGAHNAFIQVTIFWGVTGLLMLIVVVYLAYRCLPRGGGKDVLVLCLYGIAIGLLVNMMFGHGLTSKQYSLALGLLVGGHRWIWPKSIILSARRGQGHRYPAFKHTS